MLTFKVIFFAAVAPLRGPRGTPAAAPNAATHQVLRVVQRVEISTTPRLRMKTPESILIYREFRAGSDGVIPGI